MRLFNRGDVPAILSQPERDRGMDCPGGGTGRGNLSRQRRRREILPESERNRRVFRVRAARICRAGRSRDRARKLQGQGACDREDVPMRLGNVVYFSRREGDEIPGVHGYGGDSGGANSDFRGKSVAGFPESIFSAKMAEGDSLLPPFWFSRQ